MSKKRYVDAIDDMDDSMFELLGSRVSKLAVENGGKTRFRERRPNERQDSPSSPKFKRPRDR